MVRIQTDPTEYKLGSCSRCTVPRRAPLGLIVAGFGPIAGRMTPCSPPSRCGLARWGARGEVSATADLAGCLRATSVRFCGRGGRMLAVRVEQKNEAKKHDKKWQDAPLTKKVPYKPYAGKPHVRICAGGARQLASLPLKRRAFIAGLGSAAAWPMVARAQLERYRRVAIFWGWGPTDGGRSLTVFREELAVHGWIEGKNTKIEVHPTGGDADVYRSKASLLAEDPPDVIVVSSNPGLLAVMRATATIPVVFIRVGDPVASGVISNLAHPGGNVTGFTDHEASLGGKWLELLTEVAPGISRALILYHPETATQLGYLASIEAAASSLNDVTPISIGVHDSQDIEHAIEGFVAEGRGGLIALPNIITLVHRDLIVGLAAKHRLPGAFPFPSFIAAGGLLFYGVSDSYLYRGAAGYVDRILSGEKPGDLPVQTPTKFELVINLKTAKAMGLVVPPSLLARADEVIE